jgi:hypothetical protein
VLATGRVLEIVEERALLGEVSIPGSIQIVRSVEGLVRDNRVEVRVLFGASNGPAQQDGALPIAIQASMSPRRIA